jgi:hypothetical protein
MQYVNKFSRAKLERAIEHLREAQLSLLQAELYWSEDMEMRGGGVHKRIARIQEELRKWTEQSVDEILSVFIA